MGKLRDIVDVISFVVYPPIQSTFKVAPDSVSAKMQILREAEDLAREVRQVLN